MGDGRNRSCFDAFEVAEGTGAAGWREALGEISVFYQPTGDGHPAAPGLRRNGNGTTPTSAGPDSRARRWA